MKKILLSFLAFSVAFANLTFAFEQDRPQYDIETILSNYNLWSFEDATASHIVGPVVVKDKINHYTEASNIVFADLSNGHSSYVGDVSEGTVTYFYDYFYNPNFVDPIFYSSFVPEIDKIKGEVVAEPDFIDFNLAKEQFLSQSIELYNKPAIEIVEAADTVDLVAGHTYFIHDIDNIRVINIIYNSQEDNDVPTLINIKDDWTIMPTIYVNGERFDATKIYDGNVSVDYGKGSSVIWNAPYAEGTLNRISLESDILGHIVAPNVNFDNQQGGNINGCAIVNNFYGGSMELHLFPYAVPEDEEEIPVEPGTMLPEPEEGGPVIEPEHPAVTIPDDFLIPDLVGDGTEEDKNTVIPEHPAVNIPDDFLIPDVVGDGTEEDKNTVEPPIEEEEEKVEPPILEETPPVVEEQLPQTGDSSARVAIGFSVLSIAIGIFVLRRKI